MTKSPPEMSRVHMESAADPEQPSKLQGKLLFSFQAAMFMCVFNVCSFFGEKKIHKANEYFFTDVTYNCLVIL